MTEFERAIDERQRGIDYERGYRDGYVEGLNAGLKRYIDIMNVSAAPASIIISKDSEEYISIHNAIRGIK